ELTAVYIGRDRIDHRIPAIAGLQIKITGGVTAVFGRRFDALKEGVERLDEFVTLGLRKHIAEGPLAPGRQAPVDFEIQLRGDVDEGILVRRMQPAAADIEDDVRRGLHGPAAAAETVPRF